MKLKLASNLCLRSTSKTPRHATGSLAQDPVTEDDCNCQTDEVYFNEKIVIITFLNARVNK